LQFKFDGDNSIAKKVLYFGASLRGTTQYWSHRGKELGALIQYQINAKQGLPSFFTTVVYPPLTFYSGCAFIIDTLIHQKLET
jgi:hypothetical protein